MQRLGLLFLIALLLGCDAKLPTPPNATGKTRDPFGDEPESAGVGELKYGKCRALVVGVTDYSSGSLASLEGPHFDASEVASVLASRYGFEVTLKVGLITGAMLRIELENLTRTATPNDALFFFYAGHGLPGHLVPSDATLGSPTDRSTWKNVLPFGELAKLLRAPNAHHTLVALDCCFSGTALGDAFKSGVGTLGPPALKIAEKDNLARVFNRRAFQVITAGAGDESVADLVQVSKTYSALQKDLEGHSPFTGVLLQGLRGLTGRPDGRIPASDLGYYLSTTLVNENESFRAKQSPRYGAIAGEGDFLFLPTAKVLNPKLVSPLYMAGLPYAELRASACSALSRFVAGETGKADLVRAAIPHLSRALRDSEPGPRTAAARALADLAADPVAEFDVVIPLLTGLLTDPAAQAEAARALGALASLAEPSAVPAMKAYLDGLQAAWDRRLSGRRPPGEAAKRIDASPGTGSATMKDLEARRVLLAWLATEGARLVTEAETRHAKGREDLIQARQYDGSLLKFETRLLATRALGMPGHPDIGLWPGSEEEAEARILLGAFDVRPLWRSDADHPGDRESVMVRASPDGRRLLSLGDDHAVHLWDPKTGERLGTWRLRGKLANPVFSPDGTRIAAFHGSGVKVWDPSNGRIILEIELNGNYQEPVAWHPGGKLLAVGDWSGGVTVWNPETGERSAKIKAHEDEVGALAYLADGRLVSAAGDGFLRLWNLPSAEPATTLAIKACPRSLQAARGGKALVLAGSEGLQEFDPSAGKIRTLLAGDEWGLAVHPDGEHAAVRGEKGLRFVSLKDGSIAWTVSPGESPGSNPAFACDGSKIFLSEGTHILCRDAATGSLLTPIAGHTHPLRDVAFVGDGRKFASLDDSGRLLMWDALPPRPSWEAAGVLAFAGSGDGSDLFAGRKETVAALKVSDGSIRWSLKTESPISRILALPDGRLAVAEEKRVRILAAADGKEILSFEAEGAGGLAASPDGRLIACLGKSVGLHDIETGRRLWNREWPSTALSLFFHPDGAWMGVGLSDGSLRMVSLFAGDETSVIKAGGAGITAMAIFSDGGALATVAGDGIVLWNLMGSFGPQACVRIPALAEVRTISLSPDSKTLLCGAEDSLLWLWSTPRSRETRMLGDVISGSRRSGALAFSLDGTLIATPSQLNEGIRVRRATTGRQVSILRAGVGRIEDLSWCGEDRLLACGTGGAVIVGTADGKEHVRNPRASGIAVSSNGGLAAFMEAEVIVVIDPESGEKKADLKAPGVGKWSRVRFAGSDRIVAADDDGRLVVLEIATGRVAMEIRTGYLPILLMAVDPKGETAAVVKQGHRNVIEFRRLSDGAVTRRLEDPEYGLQDIAFSLDGRWMATAGQDSVRQILRVWDLARGREQVAFYRSHADRIAFNMATGEMASSGSDAQVRFWDPGMAPADMSLCLATYEISAGAVVPRVGAGAQLFPGPPPPMPPYLGESILGQAAKGPGPAELRRMACFCVLAQGDADAAAAMAGGIEGEEAADIRITIAHDLLTGARRSLENGAWRVGLRRIARSRSLGLEVTASVEYLIAGLLEGKLDGIEALFQTALLPDSQKMLLRVSLPLRKGDVAGAAKEASDILAKAEPWLDSFGRRDILEHIAGRITEAKMFENIKLDRPREQVSRGEAYYYLGLKAAATGDTAAAKSHFEEAARILLPASLEGELARFELERK